MCDDHGANLIFLQVNQDSIPGRKHNAYIARAHVARTNRAKHLASRPRSRTAGPSSKEASILGFPATRTAPRPPAVHGANPGTDEDPKGIDLDQNLSCNDPLGERSSKPDTPKKGNQQIVNAVRDIVGIDIATLAPRLQRVLAPVCGALQVTTFEWRTDEISTRLAEHLLKVTWPTMAGHEATSAWFREFCTNPLMFHVSCVAAASHRDVLAEQFMWSEKSEVLSHKVKTTQILRQKLNRLSSLSSAEVDRVIFSTVTLARHEFQKQHLTAQDILLFSPHFPNVNWTYIYERLDSNQVAALAVKELVVFQGGLGQLCLPGLASTIARIDLMGAAKTFRRPYFSSLWNADLDSFLRYSSVQLAVPAVNGEGFRHLAGLLHPSAVCIFQQLALLDQAMAHCRLITPSESEFNTLMAVRNASVHELLSLPSWDNLDAVDRKQSDYTLYEICRLACVCYANGIMLAQPPHSGWHHGFILRLQWLLQSNKSQNQPQNVQNLLIWSASLGAIASYGTSLWNFFKDFLYEALSNQGSRSWSKIQAILRMFIWSDCACEMGIAAVCEDLIKP